MYMQQRIPQVRCTQATGQQWTDNDVFLPPHRKIQGTTRNCDGFVGNFSSPELYFLISLTISRSLTLARSRSLSLSLSLCGALALALGLDLVLALTLALTLTLDLSLQGNKLELVCGFWFSWFSILLHQKKKRRGSGKKMSR